MELSRKKYKTAILFYCFHTAGVIHTFVLAPYNLLGPETSFNRKHFLQNYLIFSKSILCHARVHFIISFTLHSRVPFSVKRNFKRLCQWIVLYFCNVLCILCKHVHELYTFRLKGIEKIYTKG